MTRQREMTTVSLWRYSNWMMPPELVEQTEQAPNFEQMLKDDGWQHAADGPEGARMYMHADTPDCWEIHPQYDAER